MILVTGSTGFVGSALVERLAREQPGNVLAASRGRTASPTNGARCVSVGALSHDTDWRLALRGVSAVVHTAARVHVMNDASSDPLAEYRRTNVQGTARLARSAADAGVRRFVFVSSIKVNGESTRDGQRFSADDSPSPVDPYGVSKLEAEVELREIAASTGMEVAIVRPPLVYGPGVRANFRTLIRWVRAGVPLPLGAVDNRRSLLGLDNLVDLLIQCLEHPDAANQTFLGSDGIDVSTTQLLRRLGDALRRPARLISIPPSMLRATFALAGKSDMATRLCGSLSVDISKTKKLLGWTPPSSLEAELQRTAEDYLREARV